MFLVMQDFDRYVHEIEVDGMRCVVVYDPTEHRIRTFLPAMGDRSVPEYLADIYQHFEWEID